MKYTFQLNLTLIFILLCLSQGCYSDLKKVDVIIDEFALNNSKPIKTDTTYMETKKGVVYDSIFFGRETQGKEVYYQHHILIVKNDNKNCFMWI